MNDKPISIQIEEARQAIIGTINGLQMNPYILEPIIKEIHMSLLEAKLAQYKHDMQNQQTKEGGTDGECREGTGKN